MSATVETPLVVATPATPVLAPAPAMPVISAAPVAPETQPEASPAPDEARRPGFRDVLGLREYRAMFWAELFSFAGDQVAAVALAVLLYERSGSPFIAALGYASAFLPWAIGGPLLAVFADRFPTRRVVVTCDVARALLIGLAALPGLPLIVVGVLVLAAAFLASPFESAASAVLPLVLEDSQRYSVAVSIRSITNQTVSLVGFAVGGLLVAAVTPRGALALDAVTFAVSAVLLRRGLQHRPAAMDPEAPRHSMLADTLEGLRVVAADRRRYGPLLVAIVGAAYMVVPEAIATALAHSLGYGAVGVGLVMGAYAAGSVTGGVLLVRFTSVRAAAPLDVADGAAGIGADARPAPAAGPGPHARAAHRGRWLCVVPARGPHGVRGGRAGRVARPGLRHRLHRDVHRAGSRHPPGRRRGPGVRARHRRGWSSGRGCDLPCGVASSQDWREPGDDLSPGAGGPIR